MVCHLSTRGKIIMSKSKPPGSKPPIEAHPRKKKRRSRRGPRPGAAGPRSARRPADTASPIERGSGGMGAGAGGVFLGRVLNPTDDQSLASLEESHPPVFLFLFQKPYTHFPSGRDDQRLVIKRWPWAHSKRLQRFRSANETENSGGIKMACPEPCKELTRRLHSFMVGILPC